MSIEEQRRKAFEAWEIRENGCKPADFAMVGDRYRYSCFEVRFEVWNAALDSVQIELPEEVQIDVGMIDSVGFFEAEDVLGAIKAAGLEVKP